MKESWFSLVVRRGSEALRREQNTQLGESIPEPPPWWSLPDAGKGKGWGASSAGRWEVGAPWGGALWLEQRRRIKILLSWERWGNLEDEVSPLPRLPVDGSTLLHPFISDTVRCKSQVAKGPHGTEKRVLPTQVKMV